jgi:glycerophosphoryl diester phosphodiesterase
VEDRSADELGRLDAAFSFSRDGGRTFPLRGQGVRIPLLPDLLRRHPETRFNIDAKGREPELAEALVAALRAAGAVERACIGSEDDAQGERLRRLLPEACHFLPSRAGRAHVLSAWTGLFGSRCPAGWDVADLPHRAYGLRVTCARTVRHFHARGMKVFVWTVDEERDMRALLDAGVDGIMTDRPDLLARVIRER